MKTKNDFISFFLALMVTLGVLTGCGEVAKPFVEPIVPPYDEPSVEHVVQAYDELSTTTAYDDSWENLTHEDIAMIIETFLINYPQFAYDFSGAIVAMQGSDVIWSKASGMANSEQGVYNCFDTPFRINELTKQFTGAAILLLELDGRLSRTDTLDSFFTGHENLADFTVTDLLAMRGGFSVLLPYIMFDYLDSLTGSLDDVTSLSVDEMEAFFISHWSGELHFGFLNDGRALDATFSYTPVDYWLLGRIIEQASGTTYEEFIQSRIFTPLGMNNSGFYGMHDTAKPYQQFQSERDCVNWSHAHAFSAGGIVSTANDLKLWLDAYLNGELFPKYMLEQIFDKEYNFGWNLSPDNGIWFEETSMVGLSMGFHSYILYAPDNDIKIIMLSNGFPYVARNLVSAVYTVLSMAGLV